MIRDGDVVQHKDPAWGDRADAVVLRNLASDDLEGLWEQLWVRHLDLGKYELCCLPFFAYGLALGDVLDVAVDRDDRLVITGLARSGGRSLIRVVAGLEADVPTFHDALHALLATEGLIHEWHRSGYVAIDVPDVQRVAPFLSALDGLGLSQEMAVEIAGGPLRQHNSP